MSGKYYKTCSTSLCYFSLASYYTFAVDYAFLGIYLIWTYWLCSPVNVRDQGSHQYKTAGKVTLFELQHFQGICQLSACRDFVKYLHTVNVSLNMSIRTYASLLQ
jgi:hypothetical protein